MPGSFRIGRVGGIEIRLHVTFLLVLPVIAFAYARTFTSLREAATMAGVPPEQIGGRPLLWGTLVALALFASVLVHELAHALYAERRGGKVRDITLLMIGGVTHVTEPPRDRSHEATMALVGPVASIALAVALFVVHLLLAGTSHHALRFAIFYLAAMNLFLGAFNLLPAFPMDGGRILRGVLTKRLGSVRATHVAVTLGKAFAFLFVVASFLTLNFFLMLIAFFVFIGAQAEEDQVLAQSILGHIQVMDLAQPPPRPVPTSVAVTDVLARMLTSNQLALLVERGGDVLGVVRLEDVEKVPLEERPHVTAGALARPAPAVPPSDNVWDALRLMMREQLPLVPVMDARQLLGVLTQEDIVRSFRLQRRARAPRLARREQPV